MKLNIIWMSLGLLGAVSAVGQGTTNFEVRTVADKVNLRARPDSGSEVVAQAEDGQALVAVRIEGEWLGILAPTNAAVWVKSQFVKDGVVVGDKIKLRSGPGISYRDVGMLKKGAKVGVRGSQGEWVRIEAPPELVLWVNRGLVQERRPAAPSVIEAQEGAVAVTGVVDVATNAVLTRELPAGLSRDQLAPVLGQGAMVERAGMVERVPLAFLRGVDYRLVEVRDGVRVTVCFLEGNESQMPQLVGRRLMVKGREYWLKNQRFAVVYPELIKPMGE